MFSFEKVSGKQDVLRICKFSQDFMVVFMEIARFIEFQILG